MARNDGTGVTRLVAQHAAALAFDALPRELVDLVKQIVLDTIGVVIAPAGSLPRPASLLNMSRRWAAERKAPCSASGSKHRRRGRPLSMVASATCSTTTMSGRAAMSVSLPYPLPLPWRKSLATYRDAT